MNKILKVITPFLWAMKISWHTNWLLFLITSISTLLTSSVSGIINTYLLAQATASVAQLALGTVTIRTPIIWTIIFGLFNISLDIIRRVTNYFDTKFYYQLERAIGNVYVNKVSSFTQEQLDDADLQTKLNMAGRELYSIRSAARTVQDIVSSLIAYLLAVAVVWQFAWGIGLMLLVLVPLLAVSNYIQTKRRRKSWEESTKDWRISSSLFAYLTDPLRLFQIKIAGARENILKLRELHLAKAQNKELEIEKKNTWIALVEDIISPLIEVGTRVWAVALVAGGKLAFDQFLFVIGLIQQASSQTFSLGYNITNAQETYLAASMLKEIIEIPDRPDGTKDIRLSNANGVALVMNNVSLNYPNGTMALHNVSLDIPTGAKVAIVGENGAGKTSLLRLITRQYEPTSGDIFINDVLSADVIRDSLYDTLSILSQDYYLLDDLTIDQNLRIASPANLSKKAVNDALDTVDLLQKINKLEHGLSSRLDKSYEDGVDLSGGQRQRLSIARALLKPFRLLILDEPTSSIDAKAERRIFENIFTKSSLATVLIVSHRFATVRKADYIYVLQDGSISERGTHAELMELNGHYAELYNIQAQDFA